MYTDVFDSANQNLEIKTVYTLTEEAPNGWTGRAGRINAKMIAEEIPDYHERFFYLSGPHLMVNAFENTLLNMGISKEKIKIDFFPGFA